MSSAVGSPLMPARSTGFLSSHSNAISSAKCYIQKPLLPVFYRYRYSVKYPSPSTLMTRVSRGNVAANMRGENSITATDEPVIKTGTSSDVTTFSLALFHFLNATLKWVYLIIAIGTLGRRHNIQVTWAVMGIIASAWISKALKVLLNQRRPSSALGRRADPGMPSSHAYTLLYTTVYIALGLIGCKGLNTLTFGIGLAIILFGAYAAWVRTLEGLHTNSQVMVGSILGFITAILWHGFVLWKDCIPILKLWWAQY